MPKKLSRLIYRISLLTRLIKARFEDNEGDENITTRQILLLELLNQCDGLRVSDVYKYFPRVAASTISGDVSNLWQKGFVDKKINKESEREHIISITASGKEKIINIGKTREKTLSLLVESLNLDLEKEEIFEEVLFQAVAKMEDFLKHDVENT